MFYAELVAHYTVVFEDINEKYYSLLIDAYCEAIHIASTDESVFKLWADCLEFVYLQLYDSAFGVGGVISNAYYSIPFPFDDILDE